MRSVSEAELNELNSQARSINKHHPGAIATFGKAWIHSMADYHCPGRTCDGGHYASCTVYTPGEGNEDPRIGIGFCIDHTRYFSEDLKLMLSRDEAMAISRALYDAWEETA